MNRTRTFLCIEAVICGLPVAALMVVTAPEFLVATVGFVLSRPQASPGTSVQRMLDGMAVYAFGALAAWVVVRLVIATAQSKLFLFDAPFWAAAVVEVLLGIKLFWVLSPLAAILTVVPLLALSAHAAIIQVREIRAGTHA